MLMVHTALQPEPQSWTIDDLARLPDGGRRHEIVDGQLVVMSRVSMAHQAAVESLRHVLSAAFGERFRVWENVAIDLAPTWRVPDLTVFGAEAYTPRRLDVVPSDVALVVEVVSPGSRTTDRITKPAEYAAAGIQAFWRVDVDDVPTLTAYALEPGATAYSEVGSWAGDQHAEIALPGSATVVVPVGDLLPRRR